MKIGLASWGRLAAAVTSGVAVAALFHVPAGGLLGAMVASALFAIRTPGAQSLATPVVSYTHFVVGVVVGAGFDISAVLAGKAQLLPIVGCILLTLALSVVCGQLFRLQGVSGTTGAFATIAGGASGVMAMARAFDADESVVAVFQYLRVVMILASLPLVVSFVGGASDPSGSMSEPDGGTLVGEATYTVAVLVLAWIAVIVPWITAIPAVLTGLLVSPVLALVPLWGEVRLPGMLAGFAFVMLGMDVGLKFTRASLRQVIRLLPVGLLSIALVLVLSAGVGVLLARTIDMSWVDGYLATSPGGLPAVVAAASHTPEHLEVIVTAQTLRMVATVVLASVLLALRPRRD